MNAVDDERDPLNKLLIAMTDGRLPPVPHGLLADTQAAADAPKPNDLDEWADALATDLAAAVKLDRWLREGEPPVTDEDIADVERSWSSG